MSLLGYSCTVHYWQPGTLLVVISKYICSIKVFKIAFAQAVLIFFLCVCSFFFPAASLLVSMKPIHQSRSELYSSELRSFKELSTTCKMFIVHIVST